MNTHTLVEVLRSLNTNEMNWKFALYGTSKSRDGLELEWNICNMKGIAEWAETLRTTLLSKSAAEKTVTEYSPFLSDKEHIAAIPKDSDMIREQIADIPRVCHLRKQKEPREGLLLRGIMRGCRGSQGFGRF